MEVEAVEIASRFNEYVSRPSHKSLNSNSRSAPHRLYAHDVLRQETATSGRLVRDADDHDGSCSLAHRPLPEARALPQRNTFAQLYVGGFPRCAGHWLAEDCARLCG